MTAQGEDVASKIRIAAKLLAITALCMYVVSARGDDELEIYRDRGGDPPAAASPFRDSSARSQTYFVERNGYVSTQVNVDGAGANIVGDAANEPSLAIDPTNPNVLVIGFRQFDSVDSDFRQAGWAYSHDGGVTWTFPGVLEPGVFRSDPVLEAGPDGTIYYLSLSQEEEDDRNYKTELFRSLDGGQSWLPPVAAFGGDAPWMAVGGEVGTPRIYTTWGPDFGGDPLNGDCGVCASGDCVPDLQCDNGQRVFLKCTSGECCLPARGKQVCCSFANFSRSLDGGASFEAPTRFLGDADVPFVDGEALPFTRTVALGLDGEVIVAGRTSIDASALIPGPEPDTFCLGGGTGRTLAIYRTSNANATGGGRPSFARTQLPFMGLRPWPGPSPNGGGSTSRVEIAVDRSQGPHRGNIYVLASSSPEGGGDPLDVLLTRSTDGGSTWSQPVRVNDDPEGNGAWQWFATFDVAPNGRLDAVWNDTRNSLGDAKLSELYYAYSYDGGQTWSDNVALSPAWDSSLGRPRQSKIGDYYDAISDAHGVAVSYAATFNGEQDIYFLRAFPDCNGNQLSDVADIESGTSWDADNNWVPDECNLLSNSGFEAGGRNWDLGGGILVADAHSGQLAVRGAAGQTISRKIRATPDQRYDVSAWMKTEGVVLGAELALRFTDAAGGELERQSVGTLSGSRDYTQLSATSNAAPAGTTALEVRMELAGGEPGTATLDDVTVKLSEASAAAAAHEVCDFHVSDFGAACDGTTWDHGAFQLAVDAAGAAGGGTVCMPAGTCILAGTTYFEGRSNVRLLGKGQDVTVLKAAPAISVQPFKLANVRNTTFSHFTLDGNVGEGGNLSNGVSVNGGAMDTEVSHVTFRNMVGTWGGVGMAGSEGNVASGVVVESCNFVDVDKIGFAAFVHSERISIVKNYFEDVDQSGVYVHDAGGALISGNRFVRSISGAAASFLGVHDVRFSGNVIDGGHVLVRYHANGLAVSDNVVNNNGEFGVALYAAVGSVDISGNIIDASNNAIYVAHPGALVVTVLGNQVTTGGNGFVLGTPGEVIVSNNNFRHTAGSIGYCISVGAGANNIVAHGNQCHEFSHGIYVRESDGVSMVGNLIRSSQPNALGLKVPCDTVFFQAVGNLIEPHLNTSYPGGPICSP